MRKLLLAASTAAILSPCAQAGYFTGELEGTYVPIAGLAETMEIGGPTRPEQLGDLLVYFERTGWRDLPSSEQQRVQRYLSMYGQIRGLVNPATFLATHTFVNQSRSGILRSANDYLIPSAGDPFCSTGVPLQGVEFINLAEGSGRYAHLEAGQIKLQATINNCIGQPDYGKNNFSVLRDGSFLRFGSAGN